MPENSLTAKKPAPPVALSIAGSDSSGGAGIQADLKTFQALGCFGTTAITAITCQNTTGVSAVQGIDPGIVAGQIRDVLADFPVAAAKTGMLFSAEIIAAVSEAWRTTAGQIPLVVDPVMVATSGHRLLETTAEAALIAFLQQATLITPNLPEAEVILERSIQSMTDMHAAARELQKQTRASVLLKGGHRLQSGERPGEAVDILFDGSNIEEIARPVLSTNSTHGTGCTLSAAIAAGLSQGQSLITAVHAARDYLHGAVQHAPGLGAGSGPLNHMWNSSS
ncbi:MAG: bifunctional hydroxymethylpyrimidine kinase/phosphomethylpyrimidine kinase [bacterium]|nr:bifunctional hydroxymethylpyrimidine kinase/phosphomethylpyrimidine kinase [bacterium]